MTLRFVLASIAAVFAWLVLFEGRADAAAPRCDHRGAITFGPAPVLEEPNSSVDVAPPTDSCLEQLVRGDSYEHGRDPLPSSTSLADVAPAPMLEALIVPFELAPDPLDFAPTPLQEWRTALERPPRA